MKAKVKTKEKTFIFYEDELNDDFMDNHLSRPVIDESYKFKRDNKFNNFWSAILYYGIAKPILSAFSFFSGVKIVNKKELKKLKKQGAFIYMNHTNVFDMYGVVTYVLRGRRTNIIGYSDTTTMPVVKHIARACGLLPLPGTMEATRKFLEALEYYINEKHQYVLIFPEAHVWPYYTKIRPFVSASFHYPAKLNAPIVPIVMTYEKRRFRKKPKKVVRIGEVIYPKEGLSVGENKKYLHEECYKQMVDISESIEQFEYIKYIKTEKEN